MGVWETLEATTAASLLPSRQRGVGFGVLATVNGIGDFASSAIVGALWVVAPAASMAFVIITSLVGAAIIAHTGASAARRRARTSQSIADEEAPVANI